MTTQAARGFTIIEIMLFLAVTGLLTVSILVGSGAAIAQQRYRDSVTSFKGFIQEQYSQTSSVVNGNVNNSNPECRVQGNNLVLDGDSLRPRGTSDCLLLGRFLLIEPTRALSYDVIGRPTTEEDGIDDIATLGNYILQTSEDPEIEEVAWGAMIVEPRTTTGMTTSVMIVRSPLSGSIMTFVGSGNQRPSVLARSGVLTTAKDFCFDSQGGGVGGNRLAVRINAQAAGQSAIEIPREGDRVCD